jgi:HD-GYP domain-containing protein (c-di-GMP phosphodiesterase class II)
VPAQAALAFVAGLVVDERDPHTYRHSQRVAAYVDELARALKLSYSDIDRLRWAARLHDLGKVAVDAAVLGKNRKLTPKEWGDVWRAPRLSARLLRRFELSAAEARAVEYHRERYDGRGYYGIPAEDQPLAAHFLVVADAFDAMTSDRPYRAGLPEDEALAEIERNIGKQFHPAVAKAFVALRRGEDPFSALTPEEQEQVRGASAPYRVPEIRGAREAWPHGYVKVVCYDRSLGRQSSRLSFIVGRPVVEPGFRVSRQEGPDRRIRYTIARA